MKTSRILFVISFVLSLLVVTMSCAQPIDSDGDGWSDINEMAAGTDPYNIDSDTGTGILMMQILWMVRFH